MFLVVFCPMPLLAAEPVVSADFTTGEMKGIKSLDWRIDGSTTYYDAKLDRLTDGVPGEQRRDEYPGNPAGHNRGVLLESQTCNNLLDSSFENGLAPWQVAALDVHILEGGFHGAKLAALQGTGEIFQRLQGLITTGGEQANCGSFSVYVQSDAEQVQKLLHPFVCLVDGDKRGPNLVWDVQYLQRSDSKWTRLVAYFAIPGDLGATLTYEAGLAVTGANGLRLDAAQLEVRGGTRERYVSGYVPTGQERRARANEHADLTLQSPFDTRQGTLAVWYYETNPDPWLGALVQLPWSAGKGLELGGISALVG
jgi:hypothetical protein